MCEVKVYTYIFKCVNVHMCVCVFVHTLRETERGAAASFVYYSHTQTHNKHTHTSTHTKYIQFKEGRHSGWQLGRRVDTLEIEREGVEVQ